MILAKTLKLLAGAAAAAVIIALGSAYAQQGPRGKTSYIFPVDMRAVPGALRPVVGTEARCHARAHGNSQRAI